MNENQDQQFGQPQGEQQVADQAQTNQQAAENSQPQADQQAAAYSQPQMSCAACAMRSVGSPLTAPLTPRRPGNPDLLIRFPLWRQKARAFFAGRKD